MIILDGEEYLDGTEVCSLLQVKPATLYAYVSRGILKSYKQGIKRQRLYKKVEIEGLLKLRPSDEPVLEATPPALKEKPDIPKAEDWIPYY